MRDTASTEFANQSGQYDVATLSNFEIPYYAKAGWISDMQGIATDSTFDQADILPSMTAALSYNGKVYGEPFYGESSFLMYRKDVFAKLGITVPANPTWAQVAQWAAKADGAAARHEGHLPARPGRLGRQPGPADHRGQHDGRHLVRQQLERPGEHGWLQDGGQLLRQPDQAARRGGSGDVQLPAVPERAAAGQGRHVVRLDGRGRLARGRRLAGEGQDRLRRGSRTTRPRSRAGCTRGRGRSRRRPRSRPKPPSSSAGRRARPTSSSSPATRPTRARAARRTSRPASGPRPTPTRPTSRSPLRSRRRPSTRSRTPRRPTRASSRGPTAASSSSGSRRSPTSARRARRTSAARSPARRAWTRH